MKRVAFDVGVLFAVATAVVAYISLAEPSLRTVTLHVYLLVVGGLTMLALVTATSDALPRQARGELERALAERATPARRLPDLERMEREVTLASASTYDLYYRLLPHLRDIAAARCERRGQRMGPEQLGPWWELLRPDREPPEERFTGGISQAELRACIDHIERI